MKTFFTSVLVLLLFMGVSAQSSFKAETATEYNDFFVEHQNTIHAGLQIFNEDVAINLDTARFDLEVVNVLVLLVLDDVMAAEVYSGGAELKEAYLELFKFYDVVTKEHFVEILDLLSLTDMSEEQNLRLQTLLSDVTEREIPLDQRVKDAQEAFAKLHNFTLN